MARSLTFFAAAMLWLMIPLGLGRRLVLTPLTALFPSRHPAWVGWWFRFNSRSVMRLARVLAGVRVHQRGSMAPGPRVIVMNHQGVLDIPLIHSVTPAPYPLIPTRTRYARGVPGISGMLRIARYPMVTQKRESAARDVEQIAAAARRVASGECSLAIFPEGHRTRDGQIGPFMPRGLQTILAGTRGVPVYCLVADGMWGARTLAEAAYRLAGARVDLAVLGPFYAPESDADLPRFVGELRGLMVGTLAELRAGGAR